MGYWDGAVQGAQVANSLGNDIYSKSLLDQDLALRNQQLQQTVSENARQLAVASGARQAAANAQPTAPVTTTTTNGGYTPVPLTDASANTQALIGMQDPSTMRTQIYDPTKSIGDNDLPPGVNTISQSQFDAQTKPTDLNFSPAPAFNPVAGQQAAAADQAAQPVTTTTTTPGAPANHLKAQIDYLNSIGETQKAQALTDGIIDHANKITAMTGNPNDGLKVLNDASGQNLSFMRMANSDFIKDGEGNIVAIVNKAGLDLDMSTKNPDGTPAMTYTQALAKNSVQVNFGAGKSSLITGYLADHASDAPMDQVKGLYKVATDNGISTKMLEPVLTNLVKQATEQDANTRQIKSQEFQTQKMLESQAHSEQMQARTLAASEERQNKTLAAGRLYPVLDSKNGNAPIMITSDQNSAEPGRYLPATAGVKALGQTNKAEDIKAVVQNFQGSLSGLKAPLSKSIIAAATIATRDPHPQTAMQNVLQSAAGQTLSQDQQVYLADLAQLHENGNALQSFIGSGQGSETQRAAIQQTLPQITDSPSMQGIKLQKFSDTANRLFRGIPSVKLNATPAPIAPAGTQATHNGRVITSDGKGGWN